MALNKGQQHTIGQFFVADAQVHHPKVRGARGALALPAGGERPC
jgi:hypothetical protein